GGGGDWSKASRRGALPEKLPMAAQANDLVSTDRGQSRYALRSTGPKTEAAKRRSRRRSEDQTTDAMGTAVLETRFRGCSQALLYNGHRPHSSLDGRTPDQAYFNSLPFRAAA